MQAREGRARDQRALVCKGNRCHSIRGQVREGWIGFDEQTIRTLDARQKGQVRTGEGFPLTRRGIAHAAKREKRPACGFNPARLAVVVAPSSAVGAREQPLAQTIEDLVVVRGHRACS